MGTLSFKKWPTVYFCFFLAVAARAVKYERCYYAT